MTAGARAGGRAANSPASRMPVGSAASPTSCTASELAISTTPTSGQRQRDGAGRTARTRGVLSSTEILLALAFVGTASVQSLIGEQRPHREGPAGHDVLAFERVGVR